MNFLVGAALLIYGLYLLLFFSGGHVFIFFYAFILPILMGVRFFRDRSAYRERSANSASQPASGF